MYTVLNDKTKALEYYKRTLAVARKTGEMEMAGFVSYNIATIYKEEGNPREAYSYLIYAINTFEGLPHKSSHTDLTCYLSYVVLADVYVRLGILNQAKEAVRQADTIFERSPLAKSNECRRSLVMAQIYHHEGALEAGQEWLAKARAQATTSEQKLIISNYETSLEYQDLCTKVECLAQGIKTSASFVATKSISAEDEKTVPSITLEETM
jgi:tetratricopeptide (TPR) repeat protein